MNRHDKADLDVATPFEQAQTFAKGFTADKPPLTDFQVEQIWLNGYYACLAHAEAEHAERAKVLVDASKSLMDEAIKMAATARSGVTINGYKLSESEWDEWIVKCHEAGIALNKAIEVKNE